MCQPTAVLKTDGDLSRCALALSRAMGAVSTMLTAVWGLWAQLAYSGNVLSSPGRPGARRLLRGRPGGLRRLGLRPALCGHRRHGGLHLRGHGARRHAPSIDPAYSLTYTQAASTDTTLVIMLAVAVVFVPVMLVYTVRGYKIFSTRGHAETISARACIPPGCVTPLRPRPTWGTKARGGRSARVGLARRSRGWVPACHSACPV